MREVNCWLWYPYSSGSVPQALQLPFLPLLPPLLHGHSEGAGSGHSRTGKPTSSAVPCRAVPCRAGAGGSSGTARPAPPGTSARQRPGLRSSPRTSPLSGPGFSAGRGLPFLSKVQSLARETFITCLLRERQLVALAEVRRVFGFSRTSLLLRLYPHPPASRPESPLPFCS